MRVIDLTARRFDDLPVPRASQRRVGRVLRREEMDVWMELIGGSHPARAGDGDRVLARSLLPARRSSDNTSRCAC